MRKLGIVVTKSNLDYEPNLKEVISCSGVADIENMDCLEVYTTQSGRNLSGPDNVPAVGGHFRKLIP